MSYPYYSSKPANYLCLLNAYPQGWGCSAVVRASLDSIPSTKGGKMIMLKVKLKSSQGHTCDPSALGGISEGPGIMTASSRPTWATQGT